MIMVTGSGSVSPVAVGTPPVISSDASQICLIIRIIPLRIYHLMGRFFLIFPVLMSKGSGCLRCSIRP